jgi:putative membrane protein
MGYLWLKALHIAAVVVWSGGMLAAAVAIAALSESRHAGEASVDAAMLETVRRWDRRVTSPAMLLVWALGLVLALQGGWFAEGWLKLKLPVVLLLSALHGMLSGSLRRLGRAGGAPLPSILRHSPAAIIVCIALIVMIAVTKPL